MDQLERFRPSLKGQIAYEHLHRYAVCRECVAGAVVLDLGSGDGYGSAILGETAASVTGLDVDPETVAAANAFYGIEGRVTYQVGSAHDLPFPDASFDAVVSFEMIEHVDRQERVIAEVRRVLKPGGLFVISTPSREIYNRFKAPNEFHVKELDLQEFSELLETQFPHVAMMGERMAIVSLMAPLADGPVPTGYAGYVARYGDDLDRPETAPVAGQFPEPEYLVAFCSDQRVSATVLGHSVFMAPGDDLWVENTRVMHWASGLHEEDEVLRRRLDAAERDKADAEARLRAVEQSFNERTADHSAMAVLALRLTYELQGAADATRAALAAQVPRRRRRRPDFSRFRPVWRSLERLGLFDAQWYVSQVGGDVTAETAFAHFRTEGLEKGLNPHPFFHSGWFSLRYPELLNGRAPVMAYLRAKQRGELAPHPFFVPEFYLQLNPDVALSKADAFRHFLAAGEREGRFVHPLIDSERLISQGAMHSPEAPLLRAYLTDPALFELSPHPLFDAFYYLTENPDVQAAGINPLLHYLISGWREGRSPHPFFHNDWYLHRYPDVRAAGINPLVHYVTVGGYEGRDPNPVFDSTHYWQSNEEARESSLIPFFHFLRQGNRASFDFSTRPDVVAAAQAYRRAGRSPIEFLETLFRPQGGDATDADVEDGPWPPTAGQGYALPAGVSDYLADTARLDQRPLYNYLFGAIARAQRSRKPFRENADFRRLCARAAELSEARAARFAVTPTVSILVPVYNNIADTLVCLVSLLEQQCELHYEVLVGDDCSNDGTEQAIKQIGGVVRHVGHGVNLGFLGNCNATASLAQGDYLVLLNNDTVILSGWLEELVAAFEADPLVGLAGSKLLNWNGTLQEAGGIFWRDGSAWNFGRNADPHEPQFNYLKEVDFCSGASLAVAMDLWRQLDGFDPIYKPAYCEDADLAFRVRAAGRKVVYQPLSELVHHEGRSHGRDVTQGIKAYQVRNMERLFERWRTDLERDHFANGEEVYFARDRSASKPHILMVDHYVPQWDRDAGSRSMYHYIRLFLECGFQVSFWPDNLHRDPEYTARLQAMGVEVVYGASYVDGFEGWLEGVGGKLDYVLLSRPHIAVKYTDALAKHFKGKVLYYGIDLHYKRMELEYGITGDAALLPQIETMKIEELGLCRLVDLYMFPSQDEIDVIKAEIGPDHAGIALPLNVFADEEIATFDAVALAARDPYKLLFVGGFRHAPNVDAVKWFIGEILPRIRAAEPRYRFLVAGSHAPDDLCAGAGDEVELLGRISDEDLMRLYEQVGASVAPLRFGGGMKGKVLEALSRATPLVTTSVGVQGIPDPRRFTGVEDDAEGFARAVLAIAADPEANAERVRQGLAFIRNTYSRRVVGELMSSVVPELGGGAHSY